MQVSLRKNVLANYFGQGWQALMGLAFVPVYIHYLGIEAYGLIGVYSLLQAWLALLDMGMKPSLAREMARFTAGSHTGRSIRELLRTVETTGAAIAVLLAVAISASSGWLAVHWVKNSRMPHHVVAQALAVMGIVTALRFIEDIYSSSIGGLQRQVLQNTVTTVLSTVRGLGAVAVLAWISPTVQAFFLWQAFVSVLTVALFAAFVYKTLPPVTGSVRFSKAALMNIRGFAAGMVTITVLTLLLTQVDKLLLSRLLTLESFGYYALAGVVSNGLFLLTVPITAAIYPRFTQLAASGEQSILRNLYHDGAQLVSVLTGSMAMMLIFFGKTVVSIWTGNPSIADNVGSLVSLLSAGSLLNALIWIPYQLQLAYGWTSLTVKVDAVAVTVLVPAIIWAVHSYGATGAAFVWVLLNVGYVTTYISLMHRRLLLPCDKWTWYLRDTAFPLIVAACAALACRQFIVFGTNRITALSEIVLCAALVLTTSALAAPRIRGQAGLLIAGLWYRRNGLKNTASLASN